MSHPNPEHTAGWDREEFGPMANYATDDDAVETVSDGDETGD